MLDPAAPDYRCTPVSAERPRHGFAPENPDAAPFVTIITPFHDAAEHFEATAESVLQQSFQQWEWLIIDDGSTDPRSLEVLRRYDALDPRIRVIRQDNAGPSAARNTAFREARCEFVAQIDADDLLEPTAIEKWLWCLLSYPEYAFAKGYSVGFQAEEYLWTKGFHTAKEFLAHNMVQPNCMVRRSVHAAVGGYDEANREGFEDWDFWLRSASKGYWGGTVPEFLDWYRRRESHGDRWANWDGAARQEAFRAELKKRYPALWSGGMPEVQVGQTTAFEAVPDDVPCENRLAETRSRALFVLPWMTMGGSDRFGLDVLRQLAARDWQVTVATTLHGSNDWSHEFERHTPDVFVLENFLRTRDYPRFLRYLIASRGIDVVFISHSLFGYLLLPYLRAHCPSATFVDYCHIEEREWLNGGYPRFGVGYQELLDLNIVSSRHLRHWMADRGADPERIEVCYTSIDPDEWRRDDAARLRLRHELGIDGDACVLIYPARLCDQKRPRLFAETLRRLRRDGRRFVALVAGDGPDRGWLEGFVRKHGLHDCVRMLGRLPAGRVREAMSASDVLFLPSEWEGIALSVYEAMAAGLVVVGSDVGGQSELVDGDTGFLVPSGDEKAELEEFVRILGQCIDDPALRRQLGERAAARVADGFTLDAMGARMLELFELARRRHDAREAFTLPRAYARETATQGVEYVRLQDLATHLWVTREQRLGLHRDWRASVLGLAYRMALRAPPPVRRQLARIYRRFFVRA